jgi:uncharacterized protein
MILIPVLNLIQRFESNITLFAKRYYKIFLILIGCIHGSTNLGGSLISIFSSINYSKNKNAIRKAIAISYLCFGLIQLFIIILLKKILF